MQISQFEARLGSARGIRGQTGESKANREMWCRGKRIHYFSIVPVRRLGSSIHRQAECRGEERPECHFLLGRRSNRLTLYGGSGTLVHVADAKGPAQATVTLLALVSPWTTSKTVPTPRKEARRIHRTRWPAWAWRTTRHSRAAFSRVPSNGAMGRWRLAN